jgi:hypothetical protein
LPASRLPADADFFYRSALRPIKRRHARGSGCAADIRVWRG